MHDNKKRKDQLIKELSSARRRITKYEGEKELRFDDAQEKAKLEHFLQERIKELTCLYGISEVIERYGNSTDKILQGIVDLLPGSWQYPKITCARLIIENKKYLSSKFRTSRWKQAADIKLQGKKVGAVEVYYLKKKQLLDEGPFLKEERLLINAICERISRVIERIRVGKQLESESANLKNVNIALREVLTKVEDEKKELGRSIQANIDKVVMPVIYSIENEATLDQKSYISLLKRNLQEITSPFTSKLSKDFMSLTTAEIQICDMIKNGFSTKEIAQLRHIAPATVNIHRERIRRKLEITNKNINLTTYLHNFMSE